MREASRVGVNRTRLQECHPAFRQRLALLLAILQADGYRPRLQQCWRSPEDQLAAFTSGHSKLQWGFHNATTPDGKPDALAADVLDDDHPLEPPKAYLLALARAARKVGLTTGITWGLPQNIRTALDAAIEQGTPWEGKTGWDPCHVETTGVSVQEARNGQRPDLRTDTVNV